MRIYTDVLSRGGRGGYGILVRLCKAVSDETSEIKRTDRCT
jgi:hypothetical protein